MTICPIALAVGCKKCPIFKICPVKSLIGDVPAKSAAPAVAPTPTKAAKRAPARKKSRK